jgi:K+-sensing histidine kinase KdpD
VKDNGVGIPSGKEASVFEEFSRVGGEKTEGHGIGLSIVRRVVQRLDGNVGVYNLDPGPGCAFYFSMKESKNP